VQGVGPKVRVRTSIAGDDSYIESVGSVNSIVARFNNSVTADNCRSYERRDGTDGIASTVVGC
jgi:hypothetical protein